MFWSLDLKKLFEVEQGEKLNTWTHALAACCSAFACGLILYIAYAKQDSWRLFSFGIYAVTTVGLYFISTLYHSARRDQKDFYRRLDYIGIYLKIAGSYTPYAILALRGPLGWAILGVVWVLAVFGILWETLIAPKNRTLSLTLYGTMGLTALPVLKQLMDAIPTTGFIMVILGFICYAIGVFFFFNDERIKHGHGLWHLFVMSGASLQYLCILLYLA